MDEIRLVGHITAVELRDGQLTVTIDGQDLAFPVGAHAKPAQVQQRAPRTRKQNGHAQEQHEGMGDGVD